MGWCAYGFVEAYRATGREDFLAIARNALHYHIRRTPDDPVTFNDYDDPRIADAPRETSAAAILAASALGLEAAAAGRWAGRYRWEAGADPEGARRRLSHPTRAPRCPAAGDADARLL